MKLDDLAPEVNPQPLCHKCGMNIHMLSWAEVGGGCFPRSLCKPKKKEANVATQNWRRDLESEQPRFSMIILILNVH